MDARHRQQRHGRRVSARSHRSRSTSRLSRCFGGSHFSARLNVTKGSFYHHNDNKRDLISACFDRTFGVVRRALVLAEEATGSGWDRACAAARVLVRYQLSEHGPLLRSSATSALPDEAHRERVRRTMIQMTERMVCVLVDGMMDRSIRPRRSFNHRANRHWPDQRCRRAAPLGARRHP